jgi:hypothetical protein
LLTTTAGPQQPSPEDLEVLDFEVIDEKWNEYDLADFTKLKGRLIVTRIAKLKRGPAGQFAISTTPIFFVFAQKKGPVGQIPPQSESARLEKESVKIITSSEPWNKYRIPSTGDIIQVKLVATEVFHVKGYYDNFEEPFYIVSSAPLIAPGSKGSVTIGRPK